MKLRSRLQRRSSNLRHAAAIKLNQVVYVLVNRRHDIRQEHVVNFGPPAKKPGPGERRIDVGKYRRRALARQRGE